jgi:threonine dehydratase
MGGLAAGVASTLAWDALADLLHGAVAIPEEAWVEGMAALASGELGVPIDAGPSGASGVGALLSLSRLHDAARLLGIDPGSRIGVLVTEKRFGDPRR